MLFLMVKSVFDLKFLKMGQIKYLMVEQSKLQVDPTNLLNATAPFGIVIDRRGWFGPTIGTNLGHHHENRIEMHVSQGHMAEHVGNSRTSNGGRNRVWHLGI